MSLERLAQLTSRATILLMMLTATPLGARELLEGDASPQARSTAETDAVRAVRERSDFKSTLSPADLDARLARLLHWVEKDFARSGHLHLLSAVPEGLNARGRTNARLKTLQQTYWLQDNALYGSGALAQYSPEIARQLEKSWRAAWEQRFPAFCPSTESAVVIGLLPQSEGQQVEGRCKLQEPGDWQMHRMYQYPSPSDDAFDAQALPIIGTDYPADRSGHADVVEIKRDSARDLLKYGCLRQVVLGHTVLAHQMFNLALKQWDGTGFRNAAKAEKLPGVYWTRDVAFALLCANALNLMSLDPGSPVSLADLEQRLWQAQSPTGGIWSNYCVQSIAIRCDRHGLPPFAKQTNEIAPLVLLAYGRNIWSQTSHK